MNLYPPIIDTYMPAFVPTLAENKVNIYFSLSKFNSPTKIKGVLVSLTDPQTNKSLIKSKTDLRLFTFDEEGNKDSNRDGDDKYYITLTNTDLKTGNWEINKTYKVQIRFSSIAPGGEEGMDWIVNNSQNFSEWSTVCLITPISEPTLTLNGFTDSDKVVLSFVNNHLTGSVNLQKPEELESYRVRLYKSKDPSACLFDSGNIYTLESATNEINYEILFSFEEGVEYILRLSYITSSLYSSFQDFKFIIINTFSDNLKIDLEAKANSAEGYIELNIVPMETLFSSYMIRRASHKTNFSIWEEVDNIVLTDNIKPGESFIWRDFSAESGVWYKYCIQKRYANGDKGLTTPATSPVSLLLEDMFLLGEDQKQLKIKFDPQINSYTQTVQDTLTQTIGSKYPFIQRNGAVKYHQFGISGLISHFCDEEELFVKKEDLLYGNQELFNEYNEKNRITAYNDFTLEKEFRERVLNFLNDGKPKLYKSGAEKNMIVRLMNISLTPETALGRLIYRFSATAYEIDDFSLGNLHKYNIQIMNDYIETVKEKEDLDLEIIPGNVDVLQALNSEIAKMSSENINTIRNSINSISFYYENSPYSIKKGDSYFLGHSLEINSNEIIVNSNGEYHLTDIENMNVNSIKINTKDVGYVKVVFNVSISQEEVKDKQPETISYYSSLGQVEDLFLPTYEIVEDFIKPKYNYQIGGIEMRLYGLDKINITANENTVLYAKEGFFGDYMKIVFNEGTTTLLLDAESVAINKIHFAGTSFENPLGMDENIYETIADISFIEEGLIYQVKDISSLEINNLLPASGEEDWYINMLNQAVAGDVKKVIYYSDNWHLYHEAEQIIIHPVAAQINYSYEYEERVYN